MSRTVLIVDDSSVERVVLTGFLETEYKVIEAQSGKQALELLRSNPAAVSAVVMDIDMPGKNGFEILREIKADEMLRLLPVIITTGLDDDDSREKSIACGADNFVTKPYNRTLLLHIVRSAIKLHETAELADTLRRDPLTGLLGMSSFFREAERMINRREDGYYILSCVDVENFKVINDQYGTAMGDNVLRAIAASLTAFSAEANGLTCRYMADKFAVLFPAELKDSDIIRQSHTTAISPECLGKQLRVRVGRYVVNDRTLSVSAMFDRASMAEASIKGKYGHYLAEYEQEMLDRLLAEQKIINSMDDALANGEFEAWLQPQYNHATGALIGAEALVRWRKDGRFISPAEFVPIFERGGFIYEMDQCVWRQVCALQRKLLDEGKSPLPISINISRRDLYHVHFLEVLTGLIAEYKLPYELIRLEVTESAFSDKTITDKVSELIKLGFVLEIDDFGSGYSSLNTLKDVPASVLKLDMKFFENTENKQRGGNIVESVVRMAKWLGMAVIAEGVEKKEQADYLKSIGCYYIQGYYYARPMPSEDYVKLLDSAAKEPRLSRLETLKSLDNNEFWNPESMETLIFNSYVGGACIFEFHQEKTELLRINEQFKQEMGGLLPDGNPLAGFSVMQFLDEDNRAVLLKTIHSAISSEHEEACELSPKCGDTTEYIRVTARVIAKADERYLFYCVIVNMTAQRVAEQKRHIAEQQRLEAELARIESAKRLEVIMDNVSGGVSAIMINDDGTSVFVFTNDKYYELYGYTREQAEAASLDVMSLILPEDFGGVMDKVKRLKADRKPAVIDYRITRRDGRLAYLRANASLMFMDGYGDVITSVITDITEKIELEAQLRAIVDNINGGVSATIVHDGKPEFVVVNDRFFKILGYVSREEYESECPDKFTGLHPDDRERIINTFETSDGGKKQFTMEYRIIRRDGQIRYIRNSISIINLFGIAEPVALSVATDVTEQRETELKERSLSQQLGAIMSGIHGGVSATLHRGSSIMLTFANDGFYELFGYTRAQYEAEVGSPLLLVVREDREEYMCIAARLLHEHGTQTYEYRCKKRDGSIIWIKCSASVISVEGIGENALLSVTTDITAEKESNEQLEFLNESAHEILAQRDSTVAVNKTLDRMLWYFAGDRAYVIELDCDKQVMNNTYERCRADVVSEIDMLQDVPFSVSEHWLDLLRKNRFVVIEDVMKLGEDNAELRAILLEQDISSIIVAPLWRDGVLVGYTGVDNPTRAIAQLSRLKALADYIAILLTRRDLSRKIESDDSEMRLLMSDTPGGFLRMRLRAGRSPAIVGMNDGFCRMLGMTRREVTERYGDDAFGCLCAEDIAAASEDLYTDDSTAKGDGYFNTSCLLHRGDGGALRVMIFGRYVTDTQGQRFLNAYFTDVTQQLADEQKQKALLDNLPGGAALYEYDGETLRVIHINKSYWQLVGRDCTDYSEADVFDKIHPDDRATVRREMASAVAENRKIRVDFRVRCGDSTYKAFHVAANVTPTGGGKHLFYASYTPIAGQAMVLRDEEAADEATRLPDMAESLRGRVNPADRKYILIVDDNAVDRVILVGLLKPDFGVVTASGGAEALELLKTDHERISAIVLDIVMPEMDGYEVMRNLRATEAFAHIPIIISTCLEDDKTREKSIAYGANSFVTKPYNRALLLHAVRNAVRLRDMVSLSEQIKAEQQQKKLLDNLPGGAALLEYSDGRLTAVHINSGYRKLVSRSFDDYPDRSVLSSVYPDDRDLLGDELRSAIRQGREAAIDLRILCGDGSYKPFHAAANITREADGRYAVFASLSPITDDTMSIQEMLPIALSAVMSSSGDYSYVKDKDLHYVCCSRSVARLLGYESERDIIGKTDEELFTGEVASAFMEQNSHILKTREAVVNINSEIPSASNGIVCVSTSLYPLTDASGEVIGLYGVSHDITKEKQLDFELNTLLYTIPSGVLKYAADEGEQFEYINRSFVESLGYTEETFREKFHNCFRDMIYEEDREKAEQEVIAQESDGEIGKFDYRVETADGQLRWIHDEGVKITDRNGKSWYYVTLVDITDRVDAEKQQVELLDNLPCGAALYEYDGRKLNAIHINKRYMELVARGFSDLEDYDPISSVHPDDRAIVVAELRDAILNKRGGACDIRILYDKDNYRPFHLDAKINPERGGAYTLYVTYTAIPEQELTFRESLPFIFSTIMESSTDLSYAKDRNFRYLCCSRTFARLLGLESEQEVVGRTDYELFVKAIADRLRRTDSELIATEKPLIDVVETIPSGSGRLHYTKMSKHLLRGTTGEIIGIYGAGRDITENRETYAQLKLMTDSIPSGLATYICSSDGIHITYCNNGFCELVGTRRTHFERITATDPMSFVFEEDRPAVMRQYSLMIESDTPIDCVYRIHVKTGGYKWVHQRAVIAERHNDTVFVNSVLFDITEQQEAQERLRVSEEVNRLAIEHSGKVVARFDVRRRTLTLPEAFNRMFELPQVLDNVPEEQIAMGRISPQTAEAYKAMYISIVRGSKSGSATYQHSSEKGWRWLEAQYTTVFSSNGKPVSAVISLTDITERLEKEVVYSRWQQSLSQRDEASYTLFRCNLSKETTLDSKEGLLLNIGFDDSGMTFNERAAEYARRYILEEDREKYLSVMNSDMLLASYYRGRRSAVIEYRELIMGGMRWLRLSADLVEYPNSRDIEAYLMYEDINAKKLAELLTKEKAETDPLTGVLNRATFISLVDLIMTNSSAGEKHALFMVDVDNFKGVNDGYGHDAGDKVLCEVTRRIGGILRRDDLIGRLGGDEFIVFLKGIPGREVAAKKAEQICSLGIKIPDTDVLVTTSLGVSISPLDGASFEALYKSADDALYETKENGKNGFTFAGTVGG